MRKVQVSIKIEIFGDAAEAQWDGYEPISVYADSNNVYEALCAAFDETLTILKENGRELPSFGCKEHTPTKELIDRKQRMKLIAQKNEKGQKED